MAKKTNTGKSSKNEIKEYRFDEKRKNIPSAGIAAQGKVKETPKIVFEYNPHLPPVLRFDETGKSDKLPELLNKAKTSSLNENEIRILADALKKYEPWLEWAGKREKKTFEVDPLALHIHERISAQAILKILAREDVERSLFGDPEMEYHKAVQFYQHDMDWTNRMILGDSLHVMTSLSRRENLAGKVQMIYVDPPYGIKFASNFQPEIGKRDVKDRAIDLTREPEMIKAYRDTWTLGIHSYLTYLKDRLIVAKELLNETGSIFVQISDENVHLVRNLMDEIFLKENFVSEFYFRTRSQAASKLIEPIGDIIVWYVKDIEKVKYNKIFVTKDIGIDTGYTWLEFENGFRRKMTYEERRNVYLIPQNTKVFFGAAMLSAGRTDTGSDDEEFEGNVFKCGINHHWKTTKQGRERLKSSYRIISPGKLLNYVQYHQDFPYMELSNIWDDTHGEGDKVYVVQTSQKPIERCLLMTTDPGDLVLDPTCGSGTTAFVAEQWGRRWITIDTSRVALALARQRLLTNGVFPYYKIKNSYSNNPSKGFEFDTVSHITLKSIAQNVALDLIFAKHQPILDEELNILNNNLKKIPKNLKDSLKFKLLKKEKSEGKKSITEADKRRWVLPDKEWKEWEVPFDTDEEWPKELKDALIAYRNSWKEKMKEVNECIQANAEQEILVDRPVIESGITRVSGPFTVEAVMPAEEYLSEISPISGEPVENLKTFNVKINEPINADAYLDKMIKLLKYDGVRFPNNKILKFIRLEPYYGEIIHAEGEWQPENGHERKVGVSFGPQYGSITAYQVENAIRSANRLGFDDLIFAGFSFDGAAQAIIQEDSNPKIRCHLAHIRPDVNMGDLLKDTPSSQLFTVFGSPRTELKINDENMYIIEMQGVDIYNPVENTIIPTSADKVAAWFLDTDYDGKTFCITQAFFPDKNSWKKLSVALKNVIDEDKFAQLSKTESLPFPAGKNKMVAVKIIDPRGNEVLKIHRLDKEIYKIK